MDFSEHITPRDVARQKLLGLTPIGQVETLAKALLYALEHDPQVVTAMLSAMLTKQKPGIDNLLWAVLEEYLVYRK